MADRKVGLDTLQAWQKAREFVILVHQRVSPVLPDDEKWDLTQQIRRSSKSVMANIAEGYGRYYYQEVIRFCYIARGSLEGTSAGAGVPPRPSAKGSTQRRARWDTGPSG